MPPIRGQAELQFGIACAATAPAEARRCLEALAPRIHPSLFDDLVLLTNELVTNAIRHACEDGDWITLQVFASPDVVRVEVIDPGPGFDGRPRAASIDELGGRGLMLVDRIAQRWGVETSDRCGVWFEIDPRVCI